jgi:NADPH:quinone reductase-like Zn-dependent oxidoreductase
VKAAVYHRYGPPEVLGLEEAPTPAIGADDVLIAVTASTVCAPDWRFRAARPFFVRLFAGLRAPKHKILGMEFSGRVAAVGANVTRLQLGDEVFGSTGMSGGAHAEFLRLSQHHRLIAPKPRNLSLEAAAAIVFGGVSALFFLRKCGVKAGDNVLIYGASGSVGVYCVQLAKHFGARVTGVCSSANLELVRSLGADAVIDYTRESFASAGHVFDVIIDTVGRSGFSRALKALKPQGVYAQVALTDPLTTLLAMWTSLTGAANLVGGMARAEDGDVNVLGRLIEEGALRPVIDRVYPLAQIAEAHRLAEAGHKKGAVVVRIG